MRNLPSKDGPARPSTFNKRVEERTEEEASEDYSVEAAKDPGPEVYGWPDDDVTPTPVYLTEVPPRDESLVKWSSSRFTLRDQPVMVAGDNRNRKSVLIVNHSAANDVFVTPEQSNAVAFFGKIAPEASLELGCNSRVYVLCNTGLTAEISVFQEYSVDEETD